MSSSTRKLKISSSPLLAWFYLLAHGGALGCLFFTSLDSFACITIAFALSLSAYWNLRCQAWRNTSKAIVAVQMDETGRCRIWQRDGACIAGLHLVGGSNFPVALCLNLRHNCGKTYFLNIARDALPAQALRSLRMRFEHALLHGAPARA